LVALIVAVRREKVGFKIGQTVIYPNHGIGIIEGIEEKRIGVPIGNEIAQAKLVANSLDYHVELLLEQMKPESAKLLRLCAIPHSISASILQVLEPTVSLSEAAELCTFYSTFSFLSPNDDGLMMHDEMRHYLFSRWISPSITSDFIKANTRLVEYFEHSTKEATGVQLEALQRQRLFHMFGANLPGAFTEFERVLQKARDDDRFSECESLIKLVHQYDEALEPEYVTRLSIYEVDLAAAQEQWTTADELFRRTQSSKRLDTKQGRIISKYLRMLIARKYKSDLPQLVKLLNDRSRSQEGTKAPLRVSSGVRRAEPEPSRQTSARALPFYTIRLAATNSLVLVPVIGASEIGLRAPISSGECEMLLKSLADDFSSVAGDWKDRFKEFSEKMRSGDIFEIAEVLKTLTYISRSKPLSFREQRMLERARYLVISEIAAVMRQPECNIEPRVEQALASACLKHNRRDREFRDHQIRKVLNE
jgi:CarD family transcriptional regulator